MALVIDKRSGFCAPKGAVRVAQIGGFVGLQVDNKQIVLRTPDAVKAGLALVKHAGECQPNEFVLMTINGVEVDMLPQQAKDVGGALLRKSDFADDFQLQRGNQ